ncbi:hypothetical protein ACFWGD_04565 [Corynebacterium sp. NPDC060344]|uniref:hypothetical protein n=1 Tax=Corynebacterium sp. NPDC060344 TaxID=3347101 RepID=UPI003653EAD1
MRKAAEDRYRQLRTTGRVDIPQSMRHFLLMLVLALMFTIVGAGMVYGAIVYSDSWSEVASLPESWIGLVSVLFFGVLGIPAILIQMRWRAVLTLTWHGMAEHRMKKGERLTTSATSWRDIEGFSAQYTGGRWHTKGQYTVFMHLRPEVHARYRASLSPMMGGLQSLNEKLSAPGTIALRRFAGGPKALHELLERAHREFGSDSPRGPHH